MNIFRQGEYFAEFIAPLNPESRKARAAILTAVQAQDAEAVIAAVDAARVRFYWGRGERAIGIMPDELLSLADRWLAYIGLVWPVRR